MFQNVLPRLNTKKIINITNLFSQRANIQVADVLVVEELKILFYIDKATTTTITTTTTTTHDNSPALVVEALQQSHHRTLAAAGMADQRDCLT